MHKYRQHTSSDSQGRGVGTGAARYGCSRCQEAPVTPLPLMTRHFRSYAYGCCTAAALTGHPPCCTGTVVASAAPLVPHARSQLLLSCAALSEP